MFIVSKCIHDKSFIRKTSIIAVDQGDCYLDRISHYHRADWADHVTELAFHLKSHICTISLIVQI